MIAYFDTSAFVPLLIGQSGTAECWRLWEAADTVAASRVLYVEVTAAMAAARRMRRLGREAEESALGLLEELWGEVQVVEVGDRLARRAATLARRYALRGYDAVHCASAERFEGDVIAASGDRHLLQVWRELGLETVDPNGAG